MSETVREALKNIVTYEVCDIDGAPMSGDKVWEILRGAYRRDSTCILRARAACADHPSGNNTPDRFTDDPDAIEVEVYSLGAMGPTVCACAGFALAINGETFAQKLSFGIALKDGAHGAQLTLFE